MAPGLALAIGAACGIAAGRVPDAACLSILPALVVAAAILWWRRCRRWTAALTALGFAVCGLLLGSHARDEALRSPLRALLDRESPGFRIDALLPPAPHDPIAARIMLTEDAAVSPVVTALRGEVRAVFLHGAWRDVSGGVIVSVGGAEERRRGDGWTAGRTLEMPAVLRRPARYLNDGVPDFERDLALDGTTLFASVKSGLLVTVHERGSAVEEAAARVRRHVRTVVGRWVGAHDGLAAAIVTAVLIGDRTGLPDEVRQRLQAAGTYHVIAISGGNIAILTALCLVLLKVAGVAGRPAAFATLVVLAGYAAVVTAGASVWRATVMAAIYLAARLLDHRSPPWHALVVTAAAIVCLRPLDVRDVGFVLTFGATAALLDVARRAVAWAPRHRATAWIVGSIAASAAAEAVLLPVSAYAFSPVTSAGLVLNLAAVPLMGVVQVAGLVVTTAGSIEAVAGPAGWIAHLAARALVESARLVELLPWLSARVPPPSALTIAVYYAALAGVLLTRRWARATFGIAWAAAALVIAAGLPFPPWSSSPEPPLRLTVFDVGQGDATLLQAGGRAWLVDAGGVPFGAGTFDIGGRVLAPALWARGVRRLDAMVVTHGDPDHIGGARAVLRDFEPARAWEGVPVPQHAGLQALWRDAAALEIPVATLFAGAELSLGDARVRVLHPPPPDWERPRVRNDDSIVLEVTLGDVAILLTGDISAAIERAILPQLTPARVRILKVAHHGSRTSTSRELLHAWRPQIALISAGRGNTFGHPAPDVLRRLEEIGATVYRTDHDGQVTLETDGRRVRIRTFMGKTE